VPVNHAPQHFVRRPDRKRCAVPIHCVLNPEKRALLDLWPDQAALSSAMPGMLIWMGMNGRKGSRLASTSLSISAMAGGSARPVAN
jgi:hypothetical protein